MKKILLLFSCFYLLVNIVYSQTNTFPTSGNVGIGTLGPGTALEVKSSNDGILRLRQNGGGWNYLEFYNDTSRQGFFGMNSNEDLEFGSAAGKNTYFASGNVGIGTPSPNAHLESFATTEQLRLSYDATHYASNTVDNKGYLYIRPTGNSTYFNTAGVNNVVYIMDYTGTNRWAQLRGSALSMIDGGTTKTQILGTGNSYFTGGNVGIGTTSPGKMLDIRNDGDATIKLSKIDGDQTLTLSGGNGATGAITAQRSLQITASSGNIILSPSSNVGIGISSSSAFLDFSKSNAGGSTDLYLRNQPGTNTAGTTTTINLPVFNGAPGLRIASMGSSTGGFNVGSYDALISTGQSGSYLHFAAGSNRSPQVTISPVGNFLIGKTSQTNSSYKLDVNGDARANKIVVNTTGADYVFDSAYHLLTLDSLNTFIQQNHHLPGVPVSKGDEKRGLKYW